MVFLNTRQAQGSGQSCLGIRFLKASALFLFLLQMGLGPDQR